MNLHEYQAKNLFAERSIPVPEFRVIQNLEEALQSYADLGSSNIVVKAQVHAGGRGKAGGVVIISNKEELDSEVKRLLGSNLVTFQTDSKGQPIHQLLLEVPCEIKQELYLGAVVDRSSNSFVFMASTEGGVDIEKVAHETPEKIVKFAVDPLAGVLTYQIAAMAQALGLDKKQQKQLAHILINLYELIKQYDISLIEVNPLVINGQGDLVCLDAKVNIDDNALFRQQKLKDMRDITQEDERENYANQWELSYISLDGNIGCMVNGAGLAMATMDLVKLHGGEPANFLDVGGGATKERVGEAFKLILSDKNVQAVFVNIFGGIVRCDLIAAGIISAVAEVGIEIPVVVRLEGNNSELGSSMLADSGLNIVAENDFNKAADIVVKLTRGES